MDKKIDSLAEDMTYLIIWGVILTLVYLFLSGWLWLFVKFIMTVMLILGVREWLVDFTLLRMDQKSDEINH
ncbi:hypothetical protein KP763_04255 [Streptococcus equi subsp. equi]|uniref:hypothetical protein n=1 Tax=Streptococcus equi TaxID=1336 RepID=UPI0013F5B70B|nr:hypothetical protein [Streptococcus equi]MBT1200681.1 hypothetical protein [Streptococcus equi subsp. equi]MBT1211091.1 hypothetical protein [Streptococcus equi subsp. equi]MBT1218650.1 hypothetical protein [Streptococcus equi subsp. equi]MCD3381706.1 hypothetical protein [Streptococcus equi subsp. zooepidemicus]MCD3406712.1 hypothetical protein [Streptococcus equi subsp. zooepidemicus]